MKRITTHFGVELHLKPGQTLEQKLREMAGEQLEMRDPLEDDINAYIKSFTKGAGQ